MRYPLALAAIAMLAACGDPVPEDRLSNTEGTVAPPVAPVPELQPRETTLVPTRIDDNLLQARNLASDLGCVFRRGDEDLFAAAANSASIQSAEGLLVIDGEPLELEMEGGGGYNALTRGASFSGPGDLSATFDVSESAIDEASGEQLTGPAPMEATMELSRGGQTLNVEGIYECGPQDDA